MNVVLALALLAAPALAAPRTLAPASAVAPSAAVPSAAVRPDGSWRARAADNVCGLSDLRMLSNPAVVRFDELLQETPEMQKLVREGIDRNSPEGIQLRNAARKRVTRACEAVRTQFGHCSVWRKIEHSGEKEPTEISPQVRAKL